MQRRNPEAAYPTDFAMLAAVWVLGDTDASYSRGVLSVDDRVRQQRRGQRFTTMSFAGEEECRCNGNSLLIVSVSHSQEQKEEENKHTKVLCCVQLTAAFLVSLILNEYR